MESHERLNDEQLVQLCQSSEPQQRRRLLGLLIGRYHRRIALWCLRFSGNQEDAADLAQEICLQVTQRIDSFQGRSRFSTWLYSVARNHCLNSVQSRHVANEPIDGDVARQFPDPKANRWLEALEARSSHQELLQIMNRSLDETERQVMVLHYGQEIPLAPLTRLLRLENASGAKAYIVSARRKLEVALRRHEAKNRAVSPRRNKAGDENVP